MFNNVFPLNPYIFFLLTFMIFFYIFFINPLLLSLLYIRKVYYKIYNRYLEIFTSLTCLKLDKFNYTISNKYLKIFTSLSCLILPCLTVLAMNNNFAPFSTNPSHYNHFYFCQTLGAGLHLAFQFSYVRTERPSEQCSSPEIKFWSLHIH